MIKVYTIKSCDNCGGEVRDEDEILCRKCKPSLQRKAELRAAYDEMDAAYWRFCRCAKALPPSMAAPEALKTLIDAGIIYNKDWRP